MHSRASSSVGSGFSSRYAVMVVRNPGVQNPHWRPWHSVNACCTGLIRPASGARPSTVVITWSWAVTANIRHERIGWPSTRTVQAPHTPCSQPTWVPVSSRSWRRKSERRRRAGTAAVRRTPLTETVTSWGVSLVVSVMAGSCAVGGLGEGAAGQLRNEHAAVVGTGVDVALGLDVLAHRLGGRVERRVPRGRARLDTTEGRPEVEHGRDV